MFNIDWIAESAQYYTLFAIHTDGKRLKLGVYKKTDLLLRYLSRFEPSTKRKYRIKKGVEDDDRFEVVRKNKDNTNDRFPIVYGDI